ncbi:MAG: copper-translocating P-type ATPase [Candidatus Doudnabacteria bacterium]|nr:copper-translocating P-type ATPase [Candidatus Doudnabacteria bacterium]
MFRDRFWLSLILTIPVVLYSRMVQEWLGFRLPEFPGSAWIPFILGTVIFFYGGTVFLKGAWGELKARLPGMMTLISLAILSAYIYSLASTFFISGTEFFWELATLIVVMLFGHWMEMRSVTNAQGALKELAKLLPDTAELANGKQIPVSELKLGDVVLVRPGAKVPADGKVIDGQSDVNESMITGESKSVDKTKNSDVIAGTVNGSGSLKVEVTKVGESTALAGIMRLVAEAQNSKSRAQMLADKAAFYLTIIAIISGAATLIAWLIAGQSLGFTMERVVTVLVIACPHALGLAIPLVTSISTTLGARNGLLVKQRQALESARNIDVVLFDKTGTLTKGEQAVVDVWPIRGQNINSVLHLAASVEQTSEHSLGQAAVKAAKEKNIGMDTPAQFKAIAGHGVEAILHGKNVVSVGGPRLLQTKQVQIPEELKGNIEQADKDGKTVIYVLEDNAVVGAITIADIIREESKQAVSRLKEQGVKVAMITGDSQGVAAYVAKELGLDNYFAEVLPEHKADKVKELQKDGSKVAMVGDGVNDAPALAQADLGIAIGAGTDVAIESAGIILVKNDPRDIAKIFKLSKATYSKMVQNLVWATGYNVVAIPLAAGVLAGIGIILPPAIGALLMSASTVIVAANAQLLRRISL